MIINYRLLLLLLFFLSRACIDNVDNKVIGRLWKQRRRMDAGASNEPGRSPTGELVIDIHSRNHKWPVGDESPPPQLGRRTNLFGDQTAWCTLALTKLSTLPPFKGRIRPGRILFLFCPFKSTNRLMEKPRNSMDNQFPRATSKKVLNPCMREEMKSVNI